MAGTTRAAVVGGGAGPSVQVRRARVSLSSNESLGLIKRSLPFSSRASSQEPINVVVPGTADSDEASAMAAMFAASSQQWQQTQEQMAACVLSTLALE